MVWDVTFTCDICGKPKGEANHWWMAAVGAVPCFEDNGGTDPRDPRITLMRWSMADSQNPNMYHLCGQGCALQAVERYMNEGSIDAV